MSWDKTVAVSNACATLSALKFFPSEGRARAAIMVVLDRLANEEGQLEWLVATMPDNYDEWPGPRTVRAVFCTRYRPWDGEEADLTEGPLAAKIEQRALESHNEYKQMSGRGPDDPFLKKLLSAPVKRLQ